MNIDTLKKYLLNQKFKKIILMIL